ncbi:MAG: ribonuclease HI family protein [Patescibacteria group bacterium]
MQKIIIYTDGASVNNPGPSGAGFIIDIEGQKKEYSVSLGIKTNNQAEYIAAILAIKKLKQLIGKDKVKKTHIQVYSDSQLLVEQLNHRYKIKDKKVRDVFFDLWNETVGLNIFFTHILREKNTEADKLSKKAVDS